MTSQSDSRPSVDRREGPYASSGGHRQQNNNPHATSQYPPQANGQGTPDVSRQRFVGSGPGTDSNGNGHMQPPSLDARNGRPRDMTQNLPTRELSRNNSTPGDSPSGALATLPATKPAKRICKKCGESLTGQFVRALGGTFHLECFLCRVRIYDPVMNIIIAQFR